MVVCGENFLDLVQVSPKLPLWYLGDGPAVWVAGQICVSAMGQLRF